MKRRLAKLSDVAFFFYLGSVAHSHFGAAPGGFAALIMLVTMVYLLPSTVSGLRKAKREVEALKVNPLRPAPRKYDLTAQQLVLVERINSPDNNRSFQDMIELWESIYGQPADLTRPMYDIVAEVSVALIEKSS